ncbi:MAG TPA: cell division protein ZipA C-terminal FtsZ-binding domain-containing protein [Burkholderiales bacterium]|nr:cell division protein ZipA C-terminal FtsZ-binding domain-containing protein [Burkholderiales bacterium]
MSDLQLGLLAIGVLLVAGVFAYNRYQERAAHRSAHEKLRSAHPEALPEPAGRKEPSLPPMPPAVAVARTEPDQAALPDPLIDYVVDLAFATPQSAGTLAEAWKPNEHRFAGQVLLAVSGGGASWRRLHAGDPLPVEALRAGLQLVTRTRTVNDAQLIEFRAAVETLAGATGASVQAPELRQAAETARSLEHFCDEADLQVVIHVAAAEGAGLQRERVAAALKNGFTPAEDGHYVLRDSEANTLYVLAASEGAVSLTLDVPRVRDFPRVFRSMASFAKDLARDLGGTLVDDNRHPLDERALQAIAARLDTVRGAFEARGIASGSAAALRLFS